MAGRWLGAAVDFYRRAKKRVAELGFEDEAELEEKAALTNFDTERGFLREYAWVVLCSGFRWSVVTRIFPDIVRAFGGFESAGWIAENYVECIAQGLKVFGNRRKLEAIVATADAINTTGFDLFRKWVRKDPLNELRKLAFIGPVTVYHLAKNLGFEYAKPDRHLLRIAERFGYGKDVQLLCQTISAYTGDSILKVDLVLWRLAEQGEFELTLLETRRGNR